MRKNEEPTNEHRDHKRATFLVLIFIFFLKKCLTIFLIRFLTRFLTRALTRVLGRGETRNTVYSTTRPKEKTLKTI